MGWKWVDEGDGPTPQGQPPAQQMAAGGGANQLANQASLESARMGQYGQPNQLAAQTNSLLSAQQAASGGGGQPMQVQLEAKQPIGNIFQSNAAQIANGIPAPGAAQNQMSMESARASLGAAPQQQPASSNQQALEARSRELMGSAPPPAPSAQQPSQPAAPAQQMGYHQPQQPQGQGLGLWGQKRPGRLGLYR